MHRQPAENDQVLGVVRVLLIHPGQCTGSLQSSPRLALAAALGPAPFRAANSSSSDESLLSTVSSSGAAEAAAAALPLPRPLPLPPVLPRVAACCAITSSRAAAEAPFRAAAAAASLRPLPLPRPVATAGPSAGAGSGDLRLRNPLACWVTSSSASSAASTNLIQDGTCSPAAVIGRGAAGSSKSPVHLLDHCWASSHTPYTLS